MPAVARCRTMLGSEKMVKMSEFKYLGTVLCQHEGMEREIREPVMKHRSILGSFTGIIKGRNVSKDVKRGLRSSILLPTLTYGSENWMWSRAQQSRVCAVEMSYLRGAGGVTRREYVSNENVYKRCVMSV